MVPGTDDRKGVCQCDIEECVTQSSVIFKVSVPLAKALRKTGLCGIVRVK